MALRLLLDQGLPRDAVPLFEALGHECVHVGQLGMHAAPDRDIVARAEKEGYVVVTLDADFHTIVAVCGLHMPSVLRLRREGCKANDVVAILGPILDRYEGELASGVFISVKDGRVSIHHLPVRRV